MSKLQLRTEMVGMDPQTIERVDGWVDMLGIDNLTGQISDDIVRFIRKMGTQNIHKQSLKRYVVIYLDYLAKKYGVPLTKNYLCSTYEVNSKGWMKRLGDLRKAGLIEEINVLENFIGPAGEIIVEMKEARIIGLIQYQLATRCIDQLFIDYPNLKGGNPHLLIAFAALYTTNKMPLNEVAYLFYDLDVKLDREKNEMDKTWYYQTFRRLTKRAGLVPLT